MWQRKCVKSKWYFRTTQKKECDMWSDLMINTQYDTCDYSFFTLLIFNFGFLLFDGFDFYESHANSWYSNQQRKNIHPDCIDVNLSLVFFLIEVFFFYFCAWCFVAYSISSLLYDDFCSIFLQWKTEIFE